jgi:radical SAM protein (TIGR01212 family)
LNWFFRHTFGRRVRKISVDGGFGCPNRDGTLGTGGCVFCNVASFSPSRRATSASITQQIGRAIGRMKRKGQDDLFVAYFQPATNTYARVDRLSAAYEEALAHPGIVGLAIGTRPDCVPDDVLDLLADLSRRTWLTLEYGMQSIHDESLRWLGRGHGYAATLDAIERSQRRNLRIGVHVILGIPGESRAHVLATAREVARLRLHAVKLHNLYAVANTPLAEAFRAGSVRLCSLQEYAGCVVDFLEQIPPDCVVDRLSGDAPPDYLVAPSWCLDKSAVRAAVEAEFRRRGSWQGSAISLPH